MTKYEQVIRYVIDLERRLDTNAEQSWYRLKGFIDCLNAHYEKEIHPDRRVLRRRLP
jgi:hypothetical protein